MIFGHYHATNLVLSIVHFKWLQLMDLSALWKYFQTSLFLGKTLDPISQNH